MDELNPIDGRMYKVTYNAVDDFPFALSNFERVKFDSNNGVPVLITSAGQKIKYKPEYILFDEEPYSFLTAIKLKRDP